MSFGYDAGKLLSLRYLGSDKDTTGTLLSYDNGARTLALFGGSSQMVVVNGSGVTVNGPLRLAAAGGATPPALTVEGATLTGDVNVSGSLRVNNKPISAPTGTEVLTYLPIRTNTFSDIYYTGGDVASAGDVTPYRLDLSTMESGTRSGSSTMFSSEGPFCWAGNAAPATFVTPTKFRVVIRAMAFATTSSSSTSWTAVTSDHVSTLAVDMFRQQAGWTTLPVSFKHRTKASQGHYTTAVSDWIAVGPLETNGAAWGLGVRLLSMAAPPDSQPTSQPALLPATGTQRVFRVGYVGLEFCSTA